MFVVVCALWAGAPGGALAATWAAQPVPQQSSWERPAFGGVSCPTQARCVAVGETNPFSATVQEPLAGRWNGSSWTSGFTPVPPNSSDIALTSVSCTSPVRCVAVGQRANNNSNTMPFVQILNGTTWTTVGTPHVVDTTFATLRSVSCVRRNICTAVGTFRQSGQWHGLIERFDGSTWTLQSPSPDATNTDFYGVSCSAPNHCTAVGFQGIDGKTAPVAERWDGNVWTVQRFEVVPDSFRSQFYGVSCPTDSRCTAIGEYTSSSAAWPYFAFAADWVKGSEWKVRTIPQPDTALATYLGGVSCGSATDCVAVGSYAQSTSGDNLAMIVRTTDNVHWYLESPAKAAGDQAFLQAVSCTTPTACTAVGATESANFSTAKILVERYS